MSNSKDAPNSRDTTNSVRLEPVEGVLSDEKARYLKLRDEFHTFMQQPNLYCNTDKVHTGTMLFSCYFADVLEGFHAITLYQMRLTQSPTLLLRGMFESLVKLLYLAAAADTRDDNPSELLRRYDSLLLIDYDSKRKFDAEVEKVQKAKGELLSNAAFNYDEAVGRLISTVTKNLSFEKMIVAINNKHSSQAYLTYRFLSQRAHPMIEGMGEIWNVKTGKISVFNRTEEDMYMWFQCAADFTEGTLFALKQLLIPYHTKLDEACSNPSTSSGRTDSASID